jgi:hypothetical protein
MEVCIRLEDILRDIYFLVMDDNIIYGLDHLLSKRLTISYDM